MTEKFTITYSSSVTFQERSVSTSLFFSGFRQRPEIKEDGAASEAPSSMLVAFGLRI